MTKDLLVESKIATIVEDPDTIPMSVRHPTREDKILKKKKQKRRITIKREKEQR